MRSELAGIIVPVITPFDKNEQYAPAAMRVILDHLISCGVHGIFVAGSAGEFYALRVDEAKEVIRSAVEIVAGRVPVLAGTGAITTRDAVELSRYAEEVGADAISVITPYYVKPTEQELHAHYSAVARAVSIPVFIYTNPGRSGLVVSPEAHARLAYELPNVVGIKDSSGSIPALLDIKRLCPPNFAVFTGLDTIILDAVINHASGAVAGLANFAPALAVRVYELARAGQLAEAQVAQSQLVRLRGTYDLATFPAVVKAAASMIGMPAGPTRLPVGPLSPAAQEKLRRILTEVLGPDALTH